MPNKICTYQDMVDMGITVSGVSNLQKCVTKSEVLAISGTYINNDSNYNDNQLVKVDDVFNTSLAPYIIVNYDDSCVISNSASGWTINGYQFLVNSGEKYSLKQILRNAGDYGDPSILKFTGNVTSTNITSYPILGDLNNEGILIPTNSSMESNTQDGNFYKLYSNELTGEFVPSITFGFEADILNFAGPITTFNIGVLSDL